MSSQSFDTLLVTPPKFAMKIEAAAICASVDRGGVNEPIETRCDNLQVVL